MSRRFFCLSCLVLLGCGTDSASIQPEKAPPDTTTLRTFAVDIKMRYKASWSGFLQYYCFDSIQVELESMDDSVEYSSQVSNESSWITLRFYNESNLQNVLDRVTKKMDELKHLYPDSTYFRSITPAEP